MKTISTLAIVAILSIASLVHADDSNTIVVYTTPSVKNLTIEVKEVEEYAVPEVEVKDDNGLYMYTGAWSYHFTDYEYHNSGHDDFNENHNLFGFEYKGWLAAYYLNSFYKDSFVLGKEVWSRTYGDFDIGLYAGAVYGYASCVGEKNPPHGKAKTCAMLAPSIVYTKYKIQPAILVLGNAVAVTVRWEI